MRGFIQIFKEARLFNQWSKLIGFSGAVRLFFSNVVLLHFVFLIIAFAGSLLLFYGCHGLQFTEESKGELKLSFAPANSTKTVVREFPDSNSFILTIKNSSGTVIYDGSYGGRPSTLQIEAGSYDVSVCSRRFTSPDFDAPCYSDSKTIVIKAGEVCLLSFTCRQSNAGLRLGFTDNFKSKFKNYVPEIADSIGKKEYPFSESRFLYLNPGQVTVMLKGARPSGSSGVTDTILVCKRNLCARDMLTIQLHANISDTLGAKTGIIIDTVSNWYFDYIEIGGSGDGATKERALTVDHISEAVGKTGVWVKGYIVGGDLTSSGISFTAPFEKSSNLAIASAVSITDRSKCVSVALPEGSLRDILNLVTNPGNIGRQVYLKGTIVESYFGLKGINPLSSAEF